MTRDKNLLDLMIETDVDGARFRAQFPGIVVVHPAAFLRILSGLEHETPAASRPT